MIVVMVVCSSQASVQMAVGKMIYKRMCIELSFSGHSYIKMANEDKHIRHSHVQMKLRLPQPLTVYIAKLDDHELPWVHSDGWTLSNLEGVSYHGVRSTRHTDWSGELNEDFYGPGQVWQKTYPAGTVELRGNDGGDGSYLMFVANPSSPPVDPGTVCCMAVEASCLACQALLTVDQFCASYPGTNGCW